MPLPRETREAIAYHSCGLTTLRGEVKPCRDPTPPLPAMQTDLLSESREASMELPKYLQRSTPQLGDLSLYWSYMLSSVLICAYS